MNLKLLIFRARSRGVPVYCCFLLLVYSVYRYCYVQPPRPSRVPDYIQSYLKLDEPVRLAPQPLSGAELSRLAGTVEMMNYEREVLMAWRYGPVRADAPVLLVQVHRDLARLRLLVLSLRHVRHIHTALLVFSHSYYDAAINQLVSSITFCRVMQIFYPYSLQLYPNKFPGIDPEDCLSSGRRAGCSPRDGRLTEHKHHWWWKAYFIFNNMDWSEDYKGTVIFLEEDNYVLPDLLHMLRYTTRSKVYLQGIHVMSFGRPYSKNLDYDLLSVTAWQPPYDKGLAFNKTVWEKIVAVSSHYCMYDDVSWSYSLLNAFGQFRGGHADVVAAVAPRVLATRLFRSGRAALDQISAWLADSKMFPTRVKAVMLYDSSGRVDKLLKPPPWGNGGWSDLRDHLLCLDPLMTTTADNSNNITTSFRETYYVVDTDNISIAHNSINLSTTDSRNLF
ncbi:hypothetical protein PYW07_017500 [Mythimna separata]|uniref:Alpha-1,6-mannosyl-glycoprotein 2-beta-N-acetylglucosaminyltransferase n=1 Tax=Mythimna separata TaxID=271217 RepID=A0AAD7YY60_MYTSE|nr:hypothetical protein PYW07_017500 [Mythimna separata]